MRRKRCKTCKVVGRRKGRTFYNSAVSPSGIRHLLMGERKPDLDLVEWELLPWVAERRGEIPIVVGRIISTECGRVMTSKWRYT